ncbi:hypothetical protein [Photobacterium kagoshimensis]|uniref:hypothetical protein n=1 Tax=Photobacterium kagoshimensis TaxID=2910242 RepID=UPI003D09686F
MFVAQVSSIVALFTFGLQTAVGRYITLVGDNEEDSKEILSISTSLAIKLSMIAIAISGLITLGVYVFGDSVEYKPLIENWYIMFIFLLGTVLFIPSSITNGYYIGLQKNVVIAKINISIRIIQGILIAYTSSFGLMMMSVSYFISQIMYFSISLVLVNSEIKVRELLTYSVDVRKYTDFVGFCTTLAFWNLSLYLTSGIDGFIVGVFDVKNIGYFSLSSMLVMAFVAFCNSAYSPLIQTFTKKYNANDEEGVIKIFKMATISIVVVFVIANVISMNASNYFIDFWLGVNASEYVTPIFILAFLANSIRLIGIPFGLMLISHGEHKRVKNLPLFEGLFNLVVSLILVNVYGVYGVLIATTISSLGILLLYSTKIYNSVFKYNISKYELMAYMFITPLLISLWFLFHDFNK